MKVGVRIFAVILAAILGHSALGQTKFHWQWQKMEQDNFWQRPIVRQIKNVPMMQAIVEAEVKSMVAQGFTGVSEVELWDLAANESYE